MTNSLITNKGNPKEFKGLAISSGKVLAPICVYSQKRHEEVASRMLEADEEITLDIGRFENALAACSVELDNIALKVAKEVGENEAEIFISQKNIMNDYAINSLIKERITQERKNVEYIISEVFAEYEKKLLTIDSKYLSERSSDIGEIRRRLIDYLSGSRPGFDCKGQEVCEKEAEWIIVAEELTTEMSLHMDLNRIVGIITEHGGYSSHAAILARSIGVPAVSGVKEIYKQVGCGVTVFLDGDNGIVIIEPDEATIKRLIPDEYVNPEKVCLLSSPEGTEVLANVGILTDVKRALSVRADGIGLFRTEIAVIQKGRLLSEQEQYEFYANVLQLMEGRPVTFRLLDVGGDKEASFLQMEKEENPFLGMRGSRFLLQNFEIFSAQTKALVRLGKIGKIRILFPMIIDSMQVKELLTAFQEIMLTVDAQRENIEFGVMFEVPSACIQADTIFKMVDFASIGSNDLTQYLFAVDRNNESVSQCYNPDHPALWDVLKNLSKAAKNAGKPLSICGEIAGRENMACRLLDIGITSLSVSPRLIPRVRGEMAKHITSKQLI